MNAIVSHRQMEGTDSFHQRVTAPREPGLCNDAPGHDDFRGQVIHGLRQACKQIPCKFFYDRRGSQLFDRICELQEYYLTRAEMEILGRNADEMAMCLGPGCRFVEYGSGASVKTRLLLDRLQSPAAYVPLDIARDQLFDSAAALATAYPGLNIVPVCADYTRAFTLPSCSEAARTVIYFPGSTIGNFEPHDARDFLRSAANRAGPDGGLLIGVDLKKAPNLLHAAYNDAAQVTAAFNLNLLERINRELSGDFRLDEFVHYAFYNPRLGRIEMHLVSRFARNIHVAGETFAFREGETIFTESSYKYTLLEFASLAAAGGWNVEHIWTDERKLFSVQYLTVA
ncbi:MAG TPA: L-histidine N(alpha)-methyltransferase [Tepidisphaeraceae bacterium]|nr:L-histidine N(alpha)-methyltransferase [Tepidisphaeraceae bacterium]